MVNKTVTYGRERGNIYKEYKYDYVTKLVKTSNEGNETYHGINKCKPTET